MSGPLSSAKFIGALHFLCNSTAPAQLARESDSLCDLCGAACTSIVRICHSYKFSSFTYFFSPLHMCESLNYLNTRLFSIKCVKHVVFDEITHVTALFLLVLQLLNITLQKLQAEWSS